MKKIFPIAGTPLKKANRRYREPHSVQTNTNPFETEKGSYICPRCHNGEHPKGAKFCIICGLAFPLKGGCQNE